jgi:hypothetical protein
VLARSKSTSVDAMKEVGVLQSGAGKVRLLKWAEYPTDWDPRTDAHTPVWEALHQLIRALKQGGESASGALLAPSVEKPKPHASSPIACTPSANASAKLRTPAPTTNLLLAGPA